MEQRAATTAILSFFWNLADLLTVSFDNKSLDAALVVNRRLPGDGAAHLINFDIRRRRGRGGVTDSARLDKVLPRPGNGFVR